MEVLCCVEISADIFEGIHVTNEFAILYNAHKMFFIEIQYAIR